MTRLPRVSFLLASLWPLLASAGPAEQFAQSMQNVFEAGDRDAALKLGQFDTAPADVRAFYLGQVLTCAKPEITCTASLQPLDESVQSKLAQQVAQGVESSVAPIGVVVLEMKHQTESGSGKMRMPYGEADGKYQVAVQRYTAAKLAELRATSDESLMLKALDKGTYIDGAPQPEWKQGASALAAGGGEAGAALQQQAARLLAAANANDPDAAAQADHPDSRTFAATDYAGKPVDLATRRAKLQTHALRFRRDLEITGGWQKGDLALLQYRARDGIGWIERGVISMRKESSGWRRGVDFSVSYPSP